MGTNGAGDWEHGERAVDDDWARGWLSSCWERSQNLWCSCGWSNIEDLIILQRSMRDWIKKRKKMYILLQNTNEHFIFCGLNGSHVGWLSKVMTMCRNNPKTTVQIQSSVLKGNLECMVINVFVDIEPSECIKCISKLKHPQNMLMRC